jgi:hypothetical protein
MATTTLNFTPGNKAHLKKMLNNEYYKEIARLQGRIVSGDEDYFCECFVDKATPGHYGNTTISENMRIAQVINNSRGGRVQFGNQNSAHITFLNQIEGQPGGIQFPPKNNF